jgi:hypothetical protein
VLVLVSVVAVNVCVVCVCVVSVIVVLVTEEVREDVSVVLVSVEVAGEVALEVSVVEVVVAVGSRRISMSVTFSSVELARPFAEARSGRRSAARSSDARAPWSAMEDDRSMDWARASSNCKVQHCLEPPGHPRSS